MNKSHNYSTAVQNNLIGIRIFFYLSSSLVSLPLSLFSLSLSLIVLSLFAPCFLCLFLTPPHPNCSRYPLIRFLAYPFSRSLVFALACLIPCPHSFPAPARSILLLSLPSPSLRCHFSLHVRTLQGQTQYPHSPTTLIETHQCHQINSVYHMIKTLATPYLDITTLSPLVPIAVP